MTKLEAVNQIKFNLGRKDIDNMIDLWLNSAIDVLNDEDINFPETIQMEKDIVFKKDVYLYKLPDDYKDICYIRITKPFVYKTPVTFFKLFDVNVKQEPSVFCISNKDLLVSPIPNRDYKAKITYYSKIPYLVKDSDKFILDNANVIVEQGTIQGLQALDNGSEHHNILIKNWLIRYDVSLRKLKDKVMKFKYNWKGGYIPITGTDVSHLNPFIGIN